ncbi:MAG TPA: glycoside hydrolase family protein [Rhodanobacter sp.]|nr:glycoside hydrolase family protein [Rhodanobacter sp.]
MDDLYDRLIEHEGLRLQVYDDATGAYIRPGTRVVGNPTIGVGTLLSAPGGITEDEAHLLLRNRVNIAIAGVQRLVPDMRAANDARFDVLVEMAFQMGADGLAKFTNTLQAVRDKRWGDAADGMLASLWAQQTPSRAQALAAIMRSGQA